MDTVCWRKFLPSLIAAFSFFLLTAVPAVADIQPGEVREYERDYGISLATAEKNLEAQERGAAIVGELKAVLDEDFAGVWFDNQAGEFVIPLLPDSNAAEIASVLEDDGLGADYRTTFAESSWAALEAAQTRLNDSLQTQISARHVQTSLDPRSNAVLIHEAKSIGQAGETALLRSVAQEGHRVEIKRQNVEHFNFEPLACKTTFPRACGRPLRGGVSLTRNTNSIHPIGECSAGFKAIGNVYGNRFVLTAGHCAQLFPNWGSEDASGTFHAIGSVEESKFPVGDWGKIKANGSEYWDWNPWPSEVAHYWEDQERAINYETWSYLGQYVCHSGTSSGTSCGGVSALNVAGATGVNHATEVKGVCAEQGDSGGPVFSGNTALGLFSSGDLDFPACERPVLYVEITEATAALGVSVGTRLGGAPTAATNAASGIQATQATANGNVSPNSVETHYHFEYGTTTGYGSSLPVPDGNAGHGTGTVGVNLTLSNLQSGTTYHYRLVASSSAGTSYGADRQFVTLTPPAAVNTGSATNVYITGANGHLYQRACCFGSEGWTGWWDMGTPPGTNVRSGPAAVQTNAGYTNVYVRGANGHLYQRACCIGAEGWTSWWDMGTPPSGGITSSPAAVNTGSATNVYVRGADGHLYQRACCFGSEGWTGWWDMGGLPGTEVSSGPAAVQTNAGYTNVYVRGANGHLYQRACCIGAEGWTSWWDMGSLPGSEVSSEPAAVNTGTATNVYVRGANGDVYQRACCFGAEGWTSWWDMGGLPSGELTSGPAAVHTNAGYTNIYVQGANGHLYQRACCIGAEGWTSWWDMGSP
jgi:hypothetical protein